MQHTRPEVRGGELAQCILDMVKLNSTARHMCSGPSWQLQPKVRSDKPDKRQKQRQGLPHNMEDSLLHEAEPIDARPSQGKAGLVLLHNRRDPLRA